MNRTAIRKSRDYVQKRQEIALAAAEALSRKGVSGTTMQEIAKASGYTAASLYTYFSAKEEIVAELLRVLEAQLLETFGVKAPTGSSFAQRLELLLWSQLSVAERMRTAFALFVAAGPEVTQACDQDFSLRMEERTRRWLEAHATARDLGRHPPAEAARVLQGIAGSFVISWMRQGCRGRIADSAPRIAGWFLRGVSP